MEIFNVFKYNTNFIKQLYSIWTHKLYGLKITVDFHLVFVVTSYMEKFKGFIMGFKIPFNNFLKQRIFTGNYELCEIKLWFSRVYRALN